MPAALAPSALVPLVPSLSRGVSSLRRGRCAGSIREFSAVLERFPAHAPAYAWRGLAQLQLDRPWEAIGDFNAALRRDPARCAWVKDCLALAYRAAGVRPARAPGLRWRSTTEGELWSRRLPSLLRFFEALEYATVAAGVRRIMFRNVRPDDPFLARARSEGLHAETVFYVKRFEGFSDHHVRAGADDPQAMAHVVVARSRRDVERVRRLYAACLGAAGHEELGRLLGFPACCRDFFRRQFVQRLIGDPVYEAAAETAGARLGRDERGRELARVSGHPECNVLLRYFGARLVSWLPCSFSCEATRRAAARWLAVGRGIDAAAAAWTLELLSRPMRWACDGLSIKIDSRLFSGVAPVTSAQRPRALRYDPL
ncbi:MAG: hypothetical protein KGO96_03755 [Elusimicrobia bacterium]|nr:hypothetical protein [Elusimicrobiota bacterium]MDE2425008.1 hypothetical protein [Elusimicrobiota bacterium]